MIVRHRPRIVVLGQMAQMPFGGVVWQTLHYLLGLERLGFETWYVEAHAVAPRHFIRRPGEDGGPAAAEFVDRVLRRFGLAGRWAYHALDADGRCYGLSESGLRELYGSADALLNLHGGTRPRPEHEAAERLVCIVTDPVQMELELHRGVPESVAFFDAHSAVFSFAENYGRPDCLLPAGERFPMAPTRQPVVLELWEDVDGMPRDVFTTVANWRQRREIVLAGETYAWSKHLEFLKLVDLPSRTSQPLELALTRCPDEHRQLLREHGWSVRDALELSADLDAYRRYVATSRGEFTVAKDQNVRLRTGWFSDRSATYLAAGRPVVTQDTGFGSTLPTGEGLFAFGTADEAAAALDEIAADLPRHEAAARAIARDLFAHDVVLRPLLERAGVAVPASARAADVDRRPAPARQLRVALVAHRFPPDARGGVERYTEKVAGALCEAGHGVAVIARRPDAGLLRREVSHVAPGFAVHRVAGAHTPREQFMADRLPRERLVVAALAELDPDVVHVNHVVDLSPGVLELARRRGAAVVLTLHDYTFACQRIVLRKTDDSACGGPAGGLECARTCFAGEGAAAVPRWTLRTAYFRRLLGLADRISCPSRHVADFFGDFAPEIADRLRVVTNGIWVEPQEISSESWPTPGERGPLVLAFLGAVLPHKGLHVVLEALAAAGLDAVELTAYGPVDDGPWARALLARAAEIPGLRFRLYGEYESEDLPLLLQDIDAVVVPSQWPETFCLVAREALASGIPALTARMGALSDDVVDGVNGFSFDHDSPLALADILRRLAVDEDLLRRLRAGARATRITTLADHLAELQEVYREAIDEAARSPRGERPELSALAAALEASGFGVSAPVESAAPTAHGERSGARPSLVRLADDQSAPTLLDRTA